MTTCARWRPLAMKGICECGLRFDEHTEIVQQEANDRQLRSVTRCDSRNHAGDRCKFTADHPGDHQSYGLESWPASPCDERQSTPAALTPRIVTGVPATAADFNGVANAQAPPEICICAAVKIGDLVVRGHRHGDCLRTAGAIPGVSRDDVRSGVQGFVTSTNRFVDRREAMRLQVAAGIKSCYSSDGELRGEILFSEDLYR